MRVGVQVEFGRLQLSGGAGGAVKLDALSVILYAKMINSSVTLLLFYAQQQLANLTIVVCLPPLIEFRINCSSLRWRDGTSSNNRETSPNKARFWLTN